MIRGEIIWFYAFDVAFEADLEKIGPGLLGESAYRKAGRFRGSPETVMLYKPLVVDLAERAMPGHPEWPGIKRSVKLFAVGAVSVSLRLPFAVARLEDLQRFRRLEDAPGSGLRSLAEDSARETVERARAGLIRPNPDWTNTESYCAICVTEAPDIDGDALAWVQRDRTAVAHLLAGETSVPLAPQQVDESLRLTFAYGMRDVVLVDWDAMLVVDPERDYEEALYIAEAANLQMVELRTHDSLLEKAVDQAYAAIGEHRRRAWFLRQPGRLAQELRMQKIDLSRMSDEIRNLSKFFGDWYLARIYEGLRSRFHLAEWEEQLERGLRTVDALFDLMARESNERRMLVLEIMIVVLFVADLAILLWLGG